MSSHPPRRAVRSRPDGDGEGGGQFSHQLPDHAPGSTGLHGTNSSPGTDLRSVTRIISHRIAARHRLSEHEDPEIRTNTDSESETDLEEDLDLDEIDVFESIGIDEPSYENFS